MGVEHWIDTLAAVWASVPAAGGKFVRSYRVYGKDEFPETITEFPCALSYSQEMATPYSVSLTMEVWRGVTEFHLVPNVSRKHYPQIMLYFARIRNAAARNVKLGGLITPEGAISEFFLRTDTPSIRGPVVLQYGKEAPHLGLIVSWCVKEQVNVTVTP